MEAWCQPDAVPSPSCARWRNSVLSHQFSLPLEQKSLRRHSSKSLEARERFYEVFELPYVPLRRNNSAGALQLRFR
uniref:Uncharacterized protein n=1 Tax=Peronospora matthiolae TaxID=2874970 RepID=A0AAV1VKX6_9STRA